MISKRRTSRGRLVLLLALTAVLSACGGPSRDELLVSARKHLDDGDPRAAVIDAKNVLQRDAESAAARYLLARALLAAGDPVGAATELARAETFGHPVDETAVLRAELLLAEGRPADLFAMQQPLALTDPLARARLATLRAQAQRALEQPQAAARELADALTQVPDHLPALALRAALELDAGRVDLAQSQAEELQRTQGTAAETWVLQGDIAAARGKPIEAAEGYRRALSLKPRHADAHSKLVAQLIVAGDSAAATGAIEEMRRQMPWLAVADYLEAMVAFQRQDMARARELIERLLKAEQPDADVQLLAGMVFARLNETARAEALLAAALVRRPQSAATRRELAAVQMRQGRADRAVATVAPLLDGQPDAETLMLAGQAHARSGDLATADRLFAQAAALRPDDTALRVQQARSLLARGQQQRGLAELQAAAAADTQGLDADLVLVASHARRGNLSAARAALDVAERKQPGNSLIPFLRGVLAQQAGDMAAARTAYQLAHQRDPKAWQPVDALAMLDVAQRDVASARQRYEALAKAEPRAAAALVAIGEMAWRMGEEPAAVAGWLDKAAQADPLDAGSRLAALQLQRQLNDPAATLARAQAAAAALPAEPAILLALAAAQQATGEARQAVNTLRRVVQLDPRHAEAHWRLAIALGATGDVAAARAPLEQALALAPDSRDVLRASIAYALGERQPERALALARAVQERRPGDSLGWELEADVDVALGRLPAAAAALRTALIKRPATELAVRLHAILSAEGGAGGAPAFAQQWLDKHPDDVGFLVHLAQTADRSGDLAQAADRYRAAQRLQPDHPVVVNNLADVLVRRGDPQALALAERAVQLAPQLPNAQDTLAAALARAGRLDDALAAQRRAVARAPAAPEFRLHLGRLLAERGDKELAREELRRVTRGTAPPALQQEAEALLARLGG
ncbi:MAG: PEP-CTERM system TPR-repeat protein PrsT [Rubrivivax sp.]|nr:PEP-CTERM system TPR-repeat protein PrsT [Rubrivivax sp.]